jgi:translation initiation factor 3 subunit F
MQELAQVSEAAHKLMGMLDMVLAYVGDVLAGRSATPPDNAVGRALLDMVHSVPKMSPDEFENMLNSNIKVCFSTLPNLKFT